MGSRHSKNLPGRRAACRREAPAGYRSERESAARQAAMEPLSLRMAFASIWRMRSAETLYSAANW